MALQPVGSQWLKERLLLPQYVLTHTSFIGNNLSIEVTSKGNIEQVYGAKYRVAVDEPLHHLEFSLKYDDLNLDFLKAIFEKITPRQVKDFVTASPSGKYARRIGFLYEFLTGQQIDLPVTIARNYVDLLDSKKHVTGRIEKNARWRINNNLLGVPAFCPIVRKTRELKELLSIDMHDNIRQLKTDYPIELFARAIQYLYRKETRSSYEIEKEQPAPDRMEKFVALLQQAGNETPEEMLDQQRLTQLQRAIVDPRYAASGFRNTQIYIGESLPNFIESIHYIGPPPEMIPSLMEGLVAMATKSSGNHPAVRAALISFGFVFIHPFDDGNGRIHRFLIHDVLVQDKLVPQGLIIPVSAHMLNHIRDYDDVLEKYSKPLMQKIKYDKAPGGEIVVTNQPDIEPYLRYPDLTDQCTYLIKTIDATLTDDMPDELLFIQRYDEAKKELQRIVDMPDKKLTNMLMFLHQNKAVFPKRRREQFNELTDREIQQMQDAYRKVFGK
jgi:fido (protein-threonine AMPylation protein)